MLGPASLSFFYFFINSIKHMQGHLKEPFHYVPYINDLLNAGSVSSPGDILFMHRELIVPATNYLGEAVFLQTAA